MAPDKPPRPESTGTCLASGKGRVRTQDLEDTARSDRCAARKSRSHGWARGRQAGRQASRQQIGWLAGRPAGRKVGEVSQAARHPGSQAARQPGSQPASQAARQPGSQAARRVCECFTAGWLFDPFALFGYMTGFRWLAI